MDTNTTTTDQPTAAMSHTTLRWIAQHSADAASRQAAALELLRRCRHSHCALERDHADDHMTPRGEYFERAR